MGVQVAVEFWSSKPSPPPASTGRACASYGPGHQMHYTHQGQALRSPSLRVQRLTLDGDQIFIELDGGEELTWRHHDPSRLADVLGMFPTFQMVYPGFHALRVGPYWFNCAEDGFVPCEVGDDDA